jgi:hypothetical protein
MSFVEQEQKHENAALKRWSRREEEIQSLEDAKEQVKFALDELENWRHGRDVRRDNALGYLKAAVETLEGALFNER